MDLSSVNWRFVETLDEVFVSEGFVCVAVPVFFPEAFVPVGREGVLADAAVLFAGPSRPVGSFCDVVEENGTYNDPAVMFCGRSPSRSSESVEFSDGFDVDELCLIAMETRLGEESGFNVF